MTEHLNQGWVETNDHEDGIRRIRFFHPSHNSMPSHLLAKLAFTISEAGSDDNVSVIILESEGDRTFCAGASFDELMTIQNIEEGITFFMGFANVINACRTCPKLIIGKVQGKAVGGGVGLASAVDYCLATKFASIKLSELALGIGPFVVGPAVERKMGLSAMSQLSINAGEWKSATWAMNNGLFATLHEDNKSLEEAVMNLARILSSYSEEAKAELKMILWEGTEDWDELLGKRAGISGRLILTKASRIAIEKIKNRN